MCVSFNITKYKVYEYKIMNKISLRAISNKWQQWFYFHGGNLSEKVSEWTTRAIIDAARTCTNCNNSYG